MPATFSINLLTTSPPFFTLFSVNCGNATRMAMKSTAAAAMISRATLRYVIVVHATGMPGLRLADDTCTKTYLLLVNKRLKKTVAHGKKRRKQVISARRYRSAHERPGIGAF